MRFLSVLLLSTSLAFASGFKFLSIAADPYSSNLTITNTPGQFMVVMNTTNFTNWEIMWATNTTSNPQIVRDKCVLLHDGPTDELLGEYLWLSDTRFVGKYHTDWSINFSGTNWQVKNIAWSLVYCETDGTNVAGAYHGISGDCTGEIMLNEDHKFYIVTDSVTNSPHASTNNPNGWWYLNPVTETNCTNCAIPSP